jgi:hypothetical protein
MCDQLTGTIEIRPARPDDGRALTRLGQLDSARVPPAPLLLAFEGGELRAAISLATGAAIADPFAPTARLVELLRTEAAPPRHRPRTRSGFPLIRRRPTAWRLHSGRVARAARTF